MLGGAWILALFVLAAMGDRVVGGAVLRRWLVEAPARLASRLTLLQATVAVLAVLAALVFLFGAPELAVMIGFGDLATMLDVAILGVLLGAWSLVRIAAARAHVATRQIVRRLARPVGRRRSRAVRRRRPIAKPADDERWPDWAAAVA